MPDFVHNALREHSLVQRNTPQCTGSYRRLRETEKAEGNVHVYDDHGAPMVYGGWCNFDHDNNNSRLTGGELVSLLIIIAIIIDTLAVF